MKKTMALFSILFLLFGLSAEETGQNIYEDYIIIKFLMNQREFKKAEALIDNCLKKKPDDPFILTEKAYIMDEIKNDPQKAIEFLKKSGEIYPEYYYSNYLHARILFSAYSGKNKDKELIDKAIAYLKISLEDNKNFYNTYFLLGVIFGDIGEYRESNKYFELSNRLKETPEAYFNMSANYNNLADTQGEIETYKKILEFSPDNIHILDILSQLYLKKSDFINASEYLEKLFLLDPGHKDLSFRYLYSLFAAEKNEKFLEVSDGIDISDSSLLIYARAFILSANRRYAEAEKLLTQLTEKDLKSKLLLADIYYRKQDYYRGYQIMKKIPEKNRNNIYYSLLLDILSALNLNRKIIDVYHLLKDNEPILKQFTLNDCYNIIFAYGNLNEAGNAYQAALNFYQIGNNSSSELKECSRFLETFPGFTAARVDEISFEPNLFLIIYLYKNPGKYDREIPLIEKFLEKKTVASNSGEESIGYYIELCDIYLKQERKKKLENLLQRLMEKFPDSIIIKNYYAYYLTLQNKNLELALELSAHTLKEDCDSPAYLDTYGLVLFKSGKIDEAIGYLTRAYEKHPLEPDIIEHVAAYYRLQKNFNKIIEIYKKAIDNGVDFKKQLIEKIKQLEK